jgi:AhpD family alkylhydroperoxidase
MVHIRLPEGIPGILGPMVFSPETAKPLNALAEVLLRGPNTLTPAERELIATYVSSQNDSYFCQSAHGAVAAHHLGGNEKLVREMKLDFESAAISEKLKALLAIAGKVQKGGKLGTWAPDDSGLYRENGRRLAEEGYVNSTDALPVSG